MSTEMRQFITMIEAQQLLNESSDDSYIKSSQGGTTFAGSDSVMLFAATGLKHAINLYLKTGMKANRAYTPSNMLAAATKITKKSYKRNQLKDAAADLDVWVKTMHSGLPIESNE